MAQSYLRPILNLLDNGYFADFHGITTYYEEFEATISIQENQQTVEEIFEDYGFDVIHEKDNIYTIKREFEE